MAAHAGMIANALVAAVACAIGGPLWGGIGFLSVALVRLALEVQSLRTQNLELHTLLAQGGHAGITEHDAYDASPESEMRPKLSSVSDARISQSG